MDEKLQNQVFEYVKDAAAKISDFAAKEVPPFITEFLNWKFWEAGLSVGCWLIVFLLWASFFGTWALKRMENLKKDFENEGFVFIITSLVSLLLFVIAPFLCGVADDILTMVKISIAPKIFLLEQVKEFIK